MSNEAQESLGQFLGRVSPFHSVPPAALDRLLSQTEEVQYPKGETIYSEGESAENICIIHRGRVEILKYSCSGRPFAIETLEAGQLFGTLCRLGGGPATTYPCTAVASTDCAVVKISDRIFRDFYRLYPSVVAGLCSLCSERLAAMQAFGCTSQEPVQRRMAGVLVQLHKTYGATIPCTKRELAELAGTSIETAIRIISSFSRKGWVQSERGRIIVRTSRALELLLKPLY
ncbi:MAG TPA: Crp/Fnr family transcriptional regulator [Elusimicrobiota bacterium]|nr:Crp/Fnr family transcriptional regulator [Elusimicrobiota bacterium]